MTHLWAYPNVVLLCKYCMAYFMFFQPCTFTRQDLFCGADRTANTSVLKGVFSCDLSFRHVSNFFAYDNKKNYRLVDELIHSESVASTMSPILFPLKLLLIAIDLTVRLSLPCSGSDAGHRGSYSPITPRSEIPFFVDYPFDLWLDRCRQEVLYERTPSYRPCC